MNYRALKIRIRFTLIIIMICHVSINSQSPDTRSNVGITQNYMTDYLINYSMSHKVDNAVLCGNPESVFRPGMFQYDGDLESFISASRCVLTECRHRLYVYTPNGSISG